jgi:hypothetical protein
MIEGLINFTYNSDINKILDITVENNEALIDVIKKIHYYQKGEWKDNRTKRTDYIIGNVNVSTVPKELLSILSLFIDKDNRIHCKTKIKIIERTDNHLKMKINFKLVNKLANLIFKLLRFKIYITFDYNSSVNETSVIVNYKLKTTLPKSFNIYFNDVIENSFKPNYVYKIDEFIKTEIK